MSSVVTEGSSPFPGFEFPSSSAGDQEENLWTLLSQPSGSSVSSTHAGFALSPASGSLSSWAMVHNRSQRHGQPSPAALSPLNLDIDHQSPSFPSSNFGDNTAGTGYSITSAPADGQFMSNALHDGQSYLTAGDMLFNDATFNNSNLNDMVMSDYLNSLSGSFDLLDQQSLHQADLFIPQPLQSGPDVPPWNPTNLKSTTGDSPLFVIEDPAFVSPSPQQRYQSPATSASPRSPFNVRPENSSGGGSSVHSKRSAATSDPIVIRRTGGAARVEKKKKASAASSSSSAGQFLIVTPDSVHAHAGKPNPFECFEAARPSQKGRKGPLGDETKQNALQVRRLGACFCCHARKVGCDKERPCRNCTKLMMRVPQVICWQFPDFVPVLFPSFIRTHFRKDEMTKFMADNIAGFTIDGVERHSVVELFSGASFRTTLQIKAKFFTPKTAEVLQHWHMHVLGNRLDLNAQSAAPIGLEMDASGVLAQRDEIRKKTREYIQGIMNEPRYAEQLTDSLRHTDLPRRILKIVQKYSQRSDNAIVKKALSIYTMHCVMTRHLCLTQKSVVDLRMAQNNPWVTPRVLNRQIKSVIDEMLMRDMQVLFDAFSKSLKPKMRKEWAPCLAAFLVLCLFMEAVETAADTFVISSNEISLRARTAPEFKRSFALEVTREVENLPFKQFAFQFHQIYATHTRDATTKSFNPLLDDASMEQAELDSGAIELVLNLKKLITEKSSLDELDYLCMDPILPNQEQENHPFPRDIAYNYTGRLVAKFLLSFTDEKYIFESP